MLQNYINHIVFVIDQSGSMGIHADQVVKVFDNQIAHLAQRSKELDQETRVSVYLFSDRVSCLIYDKDCLRLPSLSGYYRAGGNTALIDGTMKAIEDLEKTATLYGDHAFLVYCLTDGEENRSSTPASALSAKIKSLPENWTAAVFVPNQNGVFEAKRFGFPAENISVWNTASVTAVEDTGKVMRQSTEAFMQARSTGLRGTKSLFNLDTSKINSNTVRASLTELDSSQYELLNVHKAAVIKPFIEGWKIPFRLGAAYYQLSKPEKVQGHKQICVQNKLNGKVYGGSNARRMLGLPDYEVKVDPVSHPDFDLFVQSTSINRNLVAGTKLLVMK